MVKWNAATNVLAGVYLTKGISEEQHIKEKCCHVHHFVWFHETMRDGLLEAKTGPLLILQYTNVDRECASLLLHLRKHGTRIL